MKKLWVILLLGVILLSVASVVSAIQGVCTGTQTCYCSGKPVSCPCNADPCKICGPASRECMEQNGQVQTGSSGNTEPTGNNAANLGNGFVSTASDIGLLVQNLGRTIIGKPSIHKDGSIGTAPTTRDRLTAAFLVAFFLIFLGLFLKTLLAKILMAGKGMSRAQPSRLNPQKVKKPIRRLPIKYRYII